MDDDDRPPWAHFSFDDEASVGTVLDWAAGALLAAVAILLVAGGITALLRPDLGGASGEWRQRVANLTQGVTLTTAALVAAASLLTTVSLRIHGGVGRRGAQRMQSLTGLLAPVMVVMASASAFAVLSQRRFEPPLGYRVYFLANSAAEIVLLVLAGTLALAGRRSPRAPGWGRPTE